MKNIIAFIVIFIVGIIFFYYYQAGWEVFEVIDTASAVALSILALFGYLEYLKNENVIKIFFDVDGKKIDTRLSILRKNFSRSELLGLLGMIQKEQVKRFEIARLKDPTILKEIQAIQTGSDKEFILKLKKEELDQFDL